MKKLFYVTSVLVFLSVIAGMLLPSNRNSRDFIYLLIMFLIYVYFFSGTAYIIRKIDKQ